MVKLVAFTSLAASATASTIGEVSSADAVGIADACAELAIAAAAILNGEVVVDPAVVGEAGVDVATAGGTGTAAPATATGSGEMSGADVVAGSVSEAWSEWASTESSETFPSFICFGGFPAA
jgi:hypothetical protein